MTNLQSSLWGVNYLLVAVLGYMLSVTVSLVLERALDAPSRVSAGADFGQTPRKTFTAYKAFLDGNMFQARRSALPIADSFPDGSGGDMSDPLPGLNVLPITLAGVFVAGSNSFAIVGDTTSNRENLYRLGDCMPKVSDQANTDCAPNQGKLMRVTTDRIIALKDNRHYFFEIAKSEFTLAGSSAPAGGGSVAAGGGGESYPATRSGNTTAMNIPNQDVDKAFSNFADVLKQARVIPHVENGVAKGFQIFQIKPDSIYQKLGLQDNDVISSVNGQPITTADQALRLFQMFRNEKQIELDVNRGGQNMRFSYTIH
ncbi:MAG: PDZ domain-containing protein [Deltaproteobacteria bacterium]|nr:PDZ domain-containing protein [Deltaproteobacteria bacterium]